MQHQTLGRRFLIALGSLLALAMACALVRMGTGPAHRRCMLTVATLAITNDSAGVRHGVFGITNVGHHSAYLLGPYGLENRSGKWHQDRLPFGAKTLGTNLMGLLQPTIRIVKPGGSCAVEVPLPCNDPKGRASFWYAEEWPALEGSLHQLCLRAGLTKESTKSLIAETEWISQPPLPEDRK